MMELSIIELESCLNINQILIDNIIRRSKINDIQNIQVQKKLNELNKQREIIIKQIENKLNDLESTLKINTLYNKIKEISKNTTDKETKKELENLI